MSERIRLQVCVSPGRSLDRRMAQDLLDEIQADALHGLMRGEGVRQSMELRMKAYTVFKGNERKGDSPKSSTSLTKQVTRLRGSTQEAFLHLLSSDLSQYPFRPK